MFWTTQVRTRGGSSQNRIAVASGRRRITVVVVSQKLDPNADPTLPRYGSDCFHLKYDLVATAALGLCGDRNGKIKQPRRHSALEPQANVLSPRSGRKHKAWGERGSASATPGTEPIAIEPVKRAAVADKGLSPISWARFSPSLTWGSARRLTPPQALCFRPLRGLRNRLTCDTPAKNLVKKTRSYWFVSQRTLRLHREIKMKHFSRVGFTSAVTPTLGTTN
jgi:hypothetical protein